MLARVNDRRGHASVPAAAPLRGASMVLLAIPLLLVACQTSPSIVPTIITPSVAPTVVATTLPTAPPVTSGPTAATTLSPTAVAGAQTCSVAGLKASHGLVEGGAGSVFTTVVLVASVPCSIDLWPAFGLKDGSGNVLVNAVSGGPGRIDLDPELSYQSNVRMANWCGNDPAYPLTFELLTGGAEVKVTGGSFPEEGSLPQCSGENAGKTFDAQPWEVVP